MADGARLLRFPRAGPPPPPALEGVRLFLGDSAVLDGVTLSLPGRGITAVMGPNGAGKSLTLRVLAGLVRPDAGTVRVRPEDARLVFQRPTLLRPSVRGDLDHALRAAGLTRRERAAEIPALLALAGLTAHADRPARRLSGGEAQRLALVRALGASPRLLLLDEPCASLDPRATAEVERLVARVAAEGTEVVLVTHDRGQAARLADRIAFLHAGRVTVSGPAGPFFRRPESEPARAYLEGRLPLLP